MKAVVVKHYNLKSMVRFKSDIPINEFYLKAVEMGFEAYIIDCKNATPPPKDYKHKGNNRYMWCPYCADKRRFYKSNNYLKCEICGVSDAEFYVRVYNKLDTREKKSKEIKNGNN
jgi:hypothetical protein